MMQEQAKRERDSVPTQLHMHASGVAASSSPDNRRTENGDQRGVNGSLKFLSKYLVAVPSSLPRIRRNEHS
jgi:hypothetical protein